MELLLLAACAAYGLLAGSFVNVVVHRVPRGESVVRPRSRCPVCAAEIRPADNLPVVSWLVLRGRCRACGAAISGRYPLVEALTALLFVAGGVRFGAVADLPAYLVLFAALVALTFIDLDHLLLPRAVVYPALLAGVVLLAAAALIQERPGAFGRAVLGAAAASGVLFVIHVIQPRGMGFGDVRLALVLGLHLGWLSLAHVALGLFLGFVLGSVGAVAAVAAGRHDRRKPLPFGPFLAAGTVLAILVGQPLLDRYPPTQRPGFADR